LFFADVVLRDEGIAELLPSCNTLVFDEAHQLPETARSFFGERISTSQLLEIARDARLELRAAGGAAGAASPELDQLVARLEKAARDVRLALGEAGARLAWSQAMRLPGFPAALEKLSQALEQLAQALAAQAERSEGIASCERRAGAARAILARLRENEGGDAVRWVEALAHAAFLHVTPLSSGELFRKQMADHPRSWIFTSATLAVGEDFNHFKRELGLDEAEARRWSSPFDFARQALLYIPKGLPDDPNDGAFTESVIEAALPVLKASAGRAFVLFTTLRALRRAHELLRGRIDFPLLVQGTGSRSELLARFRSLGNAVLLGSQSFWEGVDVRGEALSLVVIDKLPFAPPDDPVLAARIEGLRAQGGNPFTELQLPQAVLQLKQGAGRLIRDESDRGVLMLCDPRLVSRPYGRRIVQSLPPMKLTRELGEVERFFAKTASTSTRPEYGSG
jgi:ATP-dependent DNA helicase DinG